MVGRSQRVDPCQRSLSHSLDGNGLRGNLAATADEEGGAGINVRSSGPLSFLPSLDGESQSQHPFNSSKRMYLGCMRASRFRRTMFKNVSVGCFSRPLQTYLVIVPVERTHLSNYLQIIIYLSVQNIVEGRN